MRLKRTTRHESTNVTAITTGVSLRRIASISNAPMPGTRKICSVTIAPPKMPGISSATSVTTGMSALRSACFTTTMRSESPLERAVVTLIALQIPGIFTGAVITEQIFRVPGIGSLLIDAILRNDTPVIMGVTFVFACLVLLFNLIADLLYAWLDPRISYR